MTATLTIRPDGGRYRVEGLDGTFGDEEDATRAAFSEGERISRGDVPVVIQIEDTDGQHRVLHRFGPR